MSDTDIMNLCRLPGLPCPRLDSSSFSNDASRSVTELGTIFVAAMVDAKDFIDQLEGTFCNELWPAFLSELANSRSRVTELEKYVDERIKQCEEREQSEREARHEREEEITGLLTENSTLRTELKSEKEKVIFNSALGNEARRSLHEAEKAQKEKLFLENETLQQKVEMLLEENLGLEQHRQSLQKTVEQLEESAKIMSTKELLLEAENQKLANSRAFSEKSQVLHARRLSLKKHEKFPQNRSPSFSVAVKDVDPLLAISCEDPQDSHHKDLVQSLCNLQRQLSPPQEANTHIEQSLHCIDTDGETKKQLGGRPVPVEMMAVKTKHEAAEAKFVEAVCQGDIGPEKNVAEALEVACFQSPKASHDAELKPCPGHVDSDETVMDVQEETVEGGKTQEFPLIRKSTENHNAFGDEPLQLVSRKASINGVLPHVVAVRTKVDGTGVELKGGPLVSSPCRLASFRPTFRMTESNMLVNRNKDNSWKQTRSRAEPYEGDPHDSFLDTPRERAFANHLAESREQAGIPYPLAMREGVGPKNKEFLGDGVGVSVREKVAGRQDHSYPSSRVVGDTSNAGRPDKKDRALPPNPLPYKFNEAVRKKRDREALNATDCKQCKKFYDAVVAGDANGLVSSRCECHDAASRHRFKFLPPATPEGFWNIGFDDSSSRDNSG